MGITKIGWEKRRKNGKDIAWNKGKKLGHLSNYHKIKIGEAHKRLGTVPPSWKGKKRSAESVERSASKRRGKRPQYSGENNPTWKGGISQNHNKYMTNRRRSINEKKAGRKIPDQCEICGSFGKDSKRGLCFDHDHKTGKFRGWICMRCNTAIGLVKENTETLLAIREYLIKSVNGIV